MLVLVQFVLCFLFSINYPPLHGKIPFYVCFRCLNTICSIHRQICINKYSRILFSSHSWLLRIDLLPKSIFLPQFSFNVLFDCIPDCTDELGRIIHAEYFASIFESHFANRSVTASNCGVREHFSSPHREFITLYVLEWISLGESFNTNDMFCSQQMVQAGVLNSPYGATTVSVAPTVPASAFASFSNGLASTTAPQMIMTPAGQVISSLPAGFGENLTSLKMNFQTEPNHNNFLLGATSSLTKDNISTLQLASLSSLTSASTRLNGSVRSESRDESLNASNLSEQTSNSDVTSISEVSSRVFISLLLTFLSWKPLEFGLFGLIILMNDYSQINEAPMDFFHFDFNRNLYHLVIHAFFTNNQLIKNIIDLMWQANFCYLILIKFFFISQKVQTWRKTAIVIQLLRVKTSLTESCRQNSFSQPWLVLEIQSSQKIATTARQIHRADLKDCTYRIYLFDLETRIWEPCAA